MNYPLSTRGYPIIGGKADSQRCPLKAIDITFEGDRYILISFKKDNVTHFFYMLCGSIPAEAQKIYEERYK